MHDALVFAKSILLGCFLALGGLLCALCLLNCLGGAAARWWRKTGRVARCVLLAGACCLVHYAGSKSVMSKSASDDGIVLTGVKLDVTNGVAVLTATSTGAAPQPCWFRESATNAWTLATDDGWELVSAASSNPPGSYTNVWERADTNGCDHAAWYFGDNPPAVEIEASGGVEIVEFLVSGRAIGLTWNVESDVVLSAGSQIVVESREENAPWTEKSRHSASNGLGRIEFRGFHLDRTTRWRVKLEVPK